MIATIRPIGGAGIALLLFVCVSASAAYAGESISAERAREIALAQTRGGEVVELDRHYGGDGIYYYRLEIVGDNGAYHVEIDAADGALIQFIRKGGHKGGKMQKRVPDAPSAEAPGKNLTLEQATALALEHTNGGTVIDVDIDVKRGGRTVYEFEILANDAKYEIEIDGASGRIIDFERNGRRYRPITPEEILAADGPDAPPQNAPSAATPSPRLDAATAQALAQTRVGGGVVADYELETDDGRYVHEVVIVADGKRYRLEIDDATGGIRELSVR